MSQVAQTEPAWFFVHIRKTAGSSVRSALSNRFPVEQILLDWHYARRWPLAPDEYAFVTGHCPYTAVERFPVRPRVLVFLREPIERALSAYSFYKHATRALIQDFHDTLAPAIAHERERFHLRAQELELLDFLHAEPNLARRWLGDVQTRVLAGTAETDPDPALSAAELLTTALEHLQQCDVVGLSERVPESLAHLGRLDARLLDLPVPMMNRTSRRAQRTEVPVAALQLLLEWNQCDAVLYQAGVRRMERQLSGRPDAIAAELPAAFDVPDGSDFTFNQPIIGRGWHPRERHAGRWICWTGPDNTATLRLRTPAAGPLQLACRVEHVLGPEILDGLRIRYNGVALSWRREPRQEQLWLVAEIPAAERLHPADFITLEFEPPHTVRPIDLAPGCGDDRALGVAFSGVQLRSSTAASHSAQACNTSHTAGRTT